MDPMTAAFAICATALVVAVVMHSHGRRQVADTRAALAAELAAARQDNKWLSDEIARQKETLGTTQALLDAADTKLRDAFQSLAADALNSNRAAFLDLAKTSFAAFHQP